MVAASVDSSTHHGGFRPAGGYPCVRYGEGSGCVHEEYLSVCRDTEEMVVAGTLGRTTTVPLQAFQRELRTSL
jgi:hypothetical protein